MCYYDLKDHSVAKDKTNIWKWKWSAQWWISWLFLSILFNNTVSMLSQINYNFDASMIIEWKLHVTFSSSSSFSLHFPPHNAFLRGEEGGYLVWNSIINGPHSLDHAFVEHAYIVNSRLRLTNLNLILLWNVSAFFFVLQ